MAYVKKTPKAKSSNEPSDFQIFMNWAKDGNINSKMPKQLETSKAIGIPFLLYYFLQSQKYFIEINNVFNNMDAMKLSNVDVMKTFKELIHFTRYSSFSSKKAERKENPLIKELKLRFPYYKKEEIVMLVDIIDNSDDKEITYEMFGINNTCKVKKMTKSELKEHQKKFQKSMSEKDVLSIL